MIVKYYSGLQSALCVITTALLFWFTLPWALQGHSAYERTDRITKMAEKAMEVTPQTPKLPTLASKENTPPVVRIEKSFDDHVATLAHGLEILSPLSSVLISIWLWRKKKKEEKP